VEEEDMTEHEWLACRDPRPMLLFLRGKVSDRKLRLFGCACCRRVWPLLIDERSRRAVEIAEQYVDGLATLPELTAAHDKAKIAYNDGSDAFYGFRTDIMRPHSVAPHGAALHAADPSGGLWIAAAADSAAYSVFKPNSFPHDEEEANAAVAPERAAQAVLLRDILGRLPFCPRPSLDLFSITSAGGTLRLLAQSAYDGHQLPEGTLAPDLLAVLADALEEAGCRDQSVLDHLRSPGTHVRGCWPLDLILGRA
jgi:hypothetical protein